MQPPGRRADPADDDLAPAVSETPDPAGEVLHECGFLLCERQLDEHAAFVFGRPSRKRRARRRSARVLEQWRKCCCSCGEQQGGYLTTHFQAAHDTAS